MRAWASIPYTRDRWHCGKARGCLLRSKTTSVYLALPAIHPPPPPSLHPPLIKTSFVHVEFIGLRGRVHAGISRPADNGIISMCVLFLICLIPRCCFFLRPYRQCSAEALRIAQIYSPCRPRACRKSMYVMFTLARAFILQFASLNEGPLNITGTCPPSARMHADTQPIKMFICVTRMLLKVWLSPAVMNAHSWHILAQWEGHIKGIFFL